MVRNNESKDRQSIVSRRRTLLAISAGAVTLPGVAAADDSNGKRGRDNDLPNGKRGRNHGLPPENHPVWDEVNWEEGEWSDESGEFSWDEVDTEDWKVDFEPYQNSRDLRLTGSEPNLPSNREIYVGENKTAEPPELTIATNATERTLLRGSIPSSIPELGGREVTVKLIGSAAASGVGFDLDVCVSGDCISVLGFSVDPHEDSGICTSIKPGKFPLEIEPCLTFAWDGSCGLDIGGELHLCVPQDDPCGSFWNCQWCADEDISINLRDDVIERLCPDCECRIH